MTIHAAVYSILTADTGVTDLVSTRIYPIIAPESASMPYITVQRIDSQHEHFMLGSSGMTRQRVQIDCWSDSMLSASNVAEAVRESLDSYRGTVGSLDIRRASLESEDDEYEPPSDDSEDGAFRVSLDFVIWHRESAPNT